MMSLLRSVAWGLRRFPKTKRFLKIQFYKIGDLLSDKKTSPEIIKISDDSEEHLFGYYDKCPWNKTQTRMIFLEVYDADKYFSGEKPAKIILKNLLNDSDSVLSTTNTWNTQQGCMLQWLGPDFDSKIIFNDYRNSSYCSVILDINTLAETVLPHPVYSVSPDGSKAVTLDFSRLNTFRPGYGYSNIEDTTRNEFCPDLPCIWSMDIPSGKSQPLFTYKQLFDLSYKESMSGAYHKVNHLMLNPSGNRFMFLHRWIKDGIKFDRLITANYDGSDPYILLDDDMVSHSNWQDDNTIISFAKSKEFGCCYHLLQDKSTRKNVFHNEELTEDGHPSFSPNGEYLITDTYPDFRRKQKLFLCNLKTNEITQIASVYHSMKYHDETRCDLHPKWDHDSQMICFDGACAKKRQVYVIKI